jgi:hypothetical protein
VLRKTPIWNCVCGVPRFAYNSNVSDAPAFRLTPARMIDFAQIARRGADKIRAPAGKTEEMK